MDAFWTSVMYGDDNSIRGDANDIITRDADIFRTEMSFNNLNRLQLLGGVFDAVYVHANADIGLVNADEYRNSTLTGTDLEYFPNVIIADGNLDRLTVTGTAGSSASLAGTIKDLTVDVVGDVNLIS